MSKNASLTPQQAADLLARTANDGGQPGTDAAFGHGIVNLGTAMNSSNLNYVDTAVSSHFFDAETGQMEFVVQNRSGRTISGLSLNVSTGANTSTNRCQAWRRVKPTWRNCPSTKPLCRIWAACRSRRS